MRADDTRRVIGSASSRFSRSWPPACQRTGTRPARARARPSRPTRSTCRSPSIFVPRPDGQGQALLEACGVDGPPVAANPAAWPWSSAVAGQNGRRRQPGGDPGARPAREGLGRGRRPGRRWCPRGAGQSPAATGCSSSGSIRSLSLTVTISSAWSAARWRDILDPGACRPSAGGRRRWPSSTAQRRIFSERRPWCLLTLMSAQSEDVLDKSYTDLTPATKNQPKIVHRNSAPR